MRHLCALLTAFACCGCAGAVAAPHAPSSDSVVARWQPDVNWHNARKVTTHAPGTVARRLERDLAAAPRIPAGVMSCAVDTGVAVRLTIHVGTSTRRAMVRLSGCRAVTGRDGRPKVLTGRLRRDLGQFAPPRWQRYLRG